MNKTLRSITLSAIMVIVSLSSANAMTLPNTGWTKKVILWGGSPAIRVDNQANASNFIAEAKTVISNELIKENCDFNQIRESFISWANNIVPITTDTKKVATGNRTGYTFADIGARDIGIEIDVILDSITTAQNNAALAEVEKARLAILRTGEDALQLDDIFPDVPVTDIPVTDVPVTETPATTTGITAWLGDLFKGTLAKAMGSASDYITNTRLFRASAETVADDKTETTAPDTTGDDTTGDDTTGDDTTGDDTTVIDTTVIDTTVIDTTVIDTTVIDTPGDDTEITGDDDADSDSDSEATEDEETNTVNVEDEEGSCKNTAYELASGTVIFAVVATGGLVTYIAYQDGYLTPLSNLILLAPEVAKEINKTFIPLFQSGTQCIWDCGKEFVFNNISNAQDCFQNITNNVTNNVTGNVLENVGNNVTIIPLNAGIEFVKNGTEPIITFVGQNISNTCKAVYNNVVTPVANVIVNGSTNATNSTATQLVVTGGEALAENITTEGANVILTVGTNSTGTLAYLKEFACNGNGLKQILNLMGYPCK